VTARLAPFPTLTGREPCRQPDVDPDLWFSGKPQDQVDAQLRCGSCPTRTGCLAYALDHPADTEYGIWAGTTPADRDEIRTEFRTANTASKE
jgi:transcription factor WhiB